MEETSKQSKAEKALQKERQQHEAFAKALAAFLSSYLGVGESES